ncbi:MAG: hypothetical protein VX663_04080 [Pseudomonadota bacterium]|nr:hypothetical protein [Pseudomonadota bacterium]
MTVANGESAAAWLPWQPGPEPERYFSDGEVHRRLTANPASYLAHLAEALGRIGRGAWRSDMPPKWLFEDEAGDFRVMPCVIRERGRPLVKAVKVVGTNRRRSVVPDQITVGQAFLLHPADNFISHRFAACVLSSARTGACAALAARALAPQASRLRIIGCGRVGYYVARYCAAALPIDRITLQDRDGGRADRLAGWLRQQLPGAVVVKSGARAPAESGEVLVLATDSRTPLITASERPRLTVSLGADAPAQRELPDDWPLPDRVVVDTRDSRRFGDLAAWDALGRLDGVTLLELSELFTTAQPAPAASPALFISTGSALLDALTMHYLAGDPDAPLPNQQA